VVQEVAATHGDAVSHQFPTIAGLLELWLKTHYTGKPAVVFHGPLNGDVDVERSIAEWFPSATHELIFCEAAILECPTHEAAISILRDTKKDHPYLTVWDGTRIVSHH
jgi:hypothetical protein